MNLQKNKVLVVLTGSIFGLAISGIVQAEQKTPMNPLPLKEYHIDRNISEDAKECIDCHAPSKDDYFTHLVFKAYLGGKDMYKHHFGGEYDGEEVREKILDHISNERCVNCHVNLLAKPSSEEVKEAHTESLSSPDISENRCVECHEEVGHQRY